MVEERRRHRAGARRRPGLHKGKRRKGEERSYFGRSRCLQGLDFYDCTVIAHSSCPTPAFTLSGICHAAPSCRSGAATRLLNDISLFPESS